MRPLTFLAVGLIGCAGVQLPKEKLADNAGGLMFNGYTKADVGCYGCHNGDGKGSMKGPGLADELTDHTDAQLSEVIKAGDGRMPAFKDRLNDEEIGQILSWLRASLTVPAKPDAAAAAAAPAADATPAAAP